MSVGVSSSQTKSGKGEALFDFETDNADELSFKCGETITLTAWVNEEWVEGRIGDREGMFPLSFIKVLEELPKSAASGGEGGGGGGGGGGSKSSGKG